MPRKPVAPTPEPQPRWSGTRHVHDIARWFDNSVFGTPSPYKPTDGGRLPTRYIPHEPLEPDDVLELLPRISGTPAPGPAAQGAEAQTPPVSAWIPAATLPVAAVLGATTDEPVHAATAVRRHEERAVARLVSTGQIPGPGTASLHVAAVRAGEAIAAGNMQLVGLIRHGAAVVPIAMEAQAWSSGRPLRNGSLTSLRYDSAGAPIRVEAVGPDLIAVVAADGILRVTAPTIS